MMLILNLPLEVEQYLLQEANQQGLSIESLTFDGDFTNPALKGTGIVRTNSVNASGE